MMYFDVTQPITLLGIGIVLAVSLIFIYLYGYKKRPENSLPSLTRNERIRAQLIRGFSAFAIVVLLLAAFMAEAGETFAERKTGVIAYACDESRSMGAEDGVGVARIERCKNVLLELDAFPYAEVAVYGFTDGAASHSSFSRNHGYFQETVRRLIAIEAVPGAGSDLGASLRYIVEDVIEKRDELGRQAAIVVVGSDWENSGRQAELTKKQKELARAIELANRNNVVIVPLGIAGVIPTPIPAYIEGKFAGYEKDAKDNNFLTALDEETLRFVAERSGSTALTENELEDAKAFIERSLALEKVELQGAGSETASYLLIAALILFALLVKYSTLRPLFSR